MAVAKVDEPETQLASISARIGGRIDKLYLDFTGQQVHRGSAGTPTSHSPSLAAAPTGATREPCNGRRIESAWNFRDADLARLIRVAEGE